MKNNTDETTTYTATFDIGSDGLAGGLKEVRPTICFDCKCRVAKGTQLTRWLFWWRLSRQDICHARSFVEYTNYVTGQQTRGHCGFCAKINKHGNCPDFVAAGRKKKT